MPRTRKIDRKDLINDIINRCLVCYVGMADENGVPYVVPFNFGFRDEVIYLHSAKTGKKMDILRANNRVCVVFSTDHALRYQSETVACSYGMKYRSVQVTGHIEFIENFEEKITVLNIFMKKYSGREFTFNSPSIHEVAIYKVIPEKITGRESGY